ncbi:MFS transporter [Bacillus aquiflavi]|uniref:MFS transporter n=2 Tax=Bacillus aquiflavi TaxID=2672567 RepID=A0A6B3W0V8_9BACI|nr:MFS transporter [Bacillus aquiflavi]MBA4537229.1 MFS transporter [Bacillus aquiflavi]NEY81486.1 MFS transporter [Bacillus aquiflavi]UAC49506.1 MFS transporter [Bacillus aquiflavi]
MKIVGPSLGGILVASFNSDIVLIVEAFCFIFTTIILSFVHLPNIRNTSIEKVQEKKKYKDELQEGIKHIYNNTILSTAIVLSALSLFIIFLCDGLLVILSKQIGFNEAAFGIFVSLIGFGSLISSFVIG